MNSNQSNLCTTQNICFVNNGAIVLLRAYHTYKNERKEELFVFGAVVLLLAWYQLSLYAFK